MTRLTVGGQQAVSEICRRYGVGDETGLTLLDALSCTNGSMAQFNLPELGGSGQWMSGGMTMVGDMFNYGLKARVDGLCSDLAALLSTFPFLPVPVLTGGGLFAGGGGGTAGQWWPPALGVPNWQGSQNSLRYAYFAAACRLALDVNGTVTVYDTAGFVLTGVGQQQSSGYGSSLTFTGPGGIVTLDRLRRADPEWQDTSARNVTEPHAAAPAPAVLAEAAPAVHPVQVQPVEARPVEALDDRLSGTQWLYAPKAGAAFVPLTLSDDGVLTGTDADSTRYWAVEEAALWFYGADGRATARFDRIIQGPDGVQILGTNPPERGEPVVLRAYAPRAAASVVPGSPGPSMLELRLDLCAGAWSFGVRAGERIATLRLQGDGTLSGGVRPTESAWRLEGGQLVFLHKSGRPTVRFTAIEVRDGRWTFSGAALANDSIVLELRQASPSP